jgi:hypothetical protein
VSGWSEVFLGIIAFAMLATAVVQIGVLVAAGLLARRVGRLVTQVEVEMKPIFAHLNVIGRDASRAAALATAQVERVDRIFADVAQRVDQTLNSLQASLTIPAGEGRAILSALRAAFLVIRDRRGAKRRRPRGDDEDALFI